MTARTRTMANCLAAAKADLAAQSMPGGSYPAAFGKLCGIVESIDLWMKLGDGAKVADRLDDAMSFIEEWRAYHDTLRTPSFARQHSEEAH